ncbi:hypothetical protein DL96DRAFT_1619637 [Flagelloscypha sp. PMI_526]|nr:hypothetical protein DL96DRAFT_1619637 [Flagelloscypha sp. PMI_526]
MATLDNARETRRKNLPAAFKAADDPLSVYVEFVEWTARNYGESDPKSGLVPLLEEAISKFRSDSAYKKDLRYLKLWLMLAKTRDLTGRDKIYAECLNNGIGTCFAVLYEDCTEMLEAMGKLKPAKRVYRKGLRVGARPADRLKAKYAAFKARNPNLDDPPPAQPRPPSAGTRETRYAVMIEPPLPGKRREQFAFDMSLLWSGGTEYSIQEARAHSLGLLGKTWPIPPELAARKKQALEGSEITPTQHPVSVSKPVDFNDDGHKASTRTFRRRSSVATVEPTVTINTKEALAEVFDMFNTSPEKTRKLMSMKKVDASFATPGPSARPIVPPNTNENARTPGAPFRPFIDETQAFQTPSHSNQRQNTDQFTPFVDDENAHEPFNASRRGVLTPRESSHEPPARTPTTSIFSAPAHNKPPLRDSFTDDYGKPAMKMPQHERARSHHSIFAPPGTEQTPIFTRPRTENAFGKANGEENGSRPPLEPTRTPFGQRPIFRRPSAEGAFTPKAGGVSSFKPFTDDDGDDDDDDDEREKEAPHSKPAFMPFVDDDAASEDEVEPPNRPSAVAPTFTPFRDEGHSSFQPTRHHAPSSPLAQEHIPPEPEPGNLSAQYVEEDNEDEYGDDFRYSPTLSAEEEEEGREIDLDAEGDYEEPLGDEDIQEGPLKRFAAFTVMTPITERTFELTGSVRFGSEGTETGGLGLVPEDEDEDEAWSADLNEQLHDTNVDGIIQSAESLSLADSISRRSQFKPENPCNPYSPPIRTTILSFVTPDAHLHQFTEGGGWKDMLNKKMKKRASGARSSGVGLTEVVKVTLPDHQRFEVTEKLGEGAFGCVFKAKDKGVGMDEQDSDFSDMDDDDDMDDEDLSSIVAIKVVQPEDLWEYHVLRRLHSSMSPSRLRSSIVLPHALYSFPASDESLLVLQYCPHGTLLHIVNNAHSAGISQQGACLDELLVMFFTVELLRILEGIHRAGFVHGDLKIDNCLIRLEDIPANQWVAQYSATGENGWSCKGLKLIDFGRAIDTRLFPQGQRFLADWKADEKDCVAMREGKSWKEESDYYGLATIVYTMLYGKHVDAGAFVKKDEGRWGVGTSFKRYWRTETWTALFDVLLNELEGGHGEKLADIREGMENWLTANCNRTSGTLKGLLKKVELACI